MKIILIYYYRLNDKVIENQFEFKKEHLTLEKVDKYISDKKKFMREVNNEISFMSNELSIQNYKLDEIKIEMLKLEYILIIMMIKI